MLAPWIEVVSATVKPARWFTAGPKASFGGSLESVTHAENQREPSRRGGLEVAKWKIRRCGETNLRGIGTQAALDGPNEAVFFDTNPTPIKYMMKKLGLLANNEHRLPMVPATLELERRLDDVLARSGLFVR
jgi:hypothetical protein